MTTNYLQWHTSNDNVYGVMPISKIDEEKRLVSGFASLNNVDQHSDVITLEASMASFANFRGNIREMHQPIAAGKMLSFKQESYYDQKSGNMYDGVYVTAYVSKGAPDTWEKVLDGTLSGFSIGARIKDAHSEYVPDIEKTVRFVTDMELFELSLVDNPANQYANILSIQKSGDGVLVKGMAVETQAENVFWCPTDSLAISAKHESYKCSECDSEMDNIGWIEVTNKAESASELQKFVDAWTQKDVITTQTLNVKPNSQVANEENVQDNIDIVSESEGGVDMTVEENTEETVEKAAEIEEVAETETVEKAEVSEVEEVEEETVEKQEQPVEEESTFDISKEFEAFKSTVFETVKKSSEESQEMVGKFSEASEKSLEALKSLNDGIEAINAAIKGIGERVERLEKSTATKKSSDDLDGETLQKDFSWGGHFASAQTIAGN